LLLQSPPLQHTFEKVNPGLRELLACDGATGNGPACNGTTGNGPARNGTTGNSPARDHRVANGLTRDSRMTDSLARNSGMADSLTRYSGVTDSLTRYSGVSNRLGGRELGGGYRGGILDATSSGLGGGGLADDGLLVDCHNDTLEK
jgi:hypothetical protein